MAHYQNRQTGTAILLTILAAAAAISLFPFFIHAPRVLFWGVAGILVFAAWMFSTLTVTITEQKLSWKFGPGLARREVPLSDIIYTEIIKTKFVWGWGMHLTPLGMLYNVSGYDALHIKLKDGSQFLLGSNDVQNLQNAIRAGTGLDH